MSHLNFVKELSIARKNETFLDNFQHCDIVVSIHPFSINDAKHREGGAGIFHADWI